MRIFSVLGARPQFVKAAPVTFALRRSGHEDTWVHTGQHYDVNLSGLFFEQLGLPPPAANLGVGSGSHGVQTGRMLAALDDLLASGQPDWVLVYGDTNSTLAGALCAVKLGLRVAHVESGLRSFDRGMPEEINRVLVDHCADLLLCPTERARHNLESEGLGARAWVVGDTMLDALQIYLARAPARAATLADCGLGDDDYVLVTIHRASNAHDRKALKALVESLLALRLPAVFPLHPRTRPALEEVLGQIGPAAREAVRTVPPVGYLEMLALERGARCVVTDSGGVQKEAYLLGVPCLTLRRETEWPETLEDGWNVLVPADAAALAAALRQQTGRHGAAPARRAFGDGHAAEAIVAELERHQGARRG